MSNILITRRLEWDSAHRVLHHESKCRTPHGHRYVAIVSLTATRLDGCHRILDFGVVKEKVGGWIDANWDHTTLLNSEDFAFRTFCEAEEERGCKPAYVFQYREPTAEVIAEELFVKAEELLADTGISIDAVEVFETPNCSAVCRGR